MSEKERATSGQLTTADLDRVLMDECVLQALADLGATFRRDI